MKKNISIFMAALGIIITCHHLGAQEITTVTADLESWYSVGLKAKLTKQLDISLDQGLRLKTNSSEVDQVLTNLAVGYSPFKHFEFGLGLRYISDQDKNQDYDNDFRYNIDASYNNKVSRLKYKLRLRYQNKNELGISQAEGDTHKPYGRAKLGLEYNIKNWKLDPKVSTEVFRDFSSEGEFDRLRLTLGTSYKIKKYGEFDLFYRIEREINTTLPKTTYVAGLKYTYTFKTY